MTLAYDPHAGRIRPAHWLWDYHGPGRHGVRFGIHGPIFTEPQVSITARIAAMNRVENGDETSGLLLLETMRDILSHWIDGDVAITINADGQQGHSEFRFRWGAETNRQFETSPASSEKCTG